MVETKVYIDFISVDGAEGGTGAAPVEFSDHLGLVVGLGRLMKAKRITCLSPRMFDKMWPDSKAVSKRFEKEL